MDPDPANGIYGVAPVPIVGTQRYTVFLPDLDAANAWIRDVYPSYSSIFLTPFDPVRQYFILNKENFLAWLNVAGIYNNLTLNTGQPDDFSQNFSPRGSGVNAVQEKRADYGANQPPAAAKGTPTISLGLDEYLALIYQQLLDVGRIAKADIVLQIKKDFDAGKIDKTEALDRLTAANIYG